MRLMLTSHLQVLKSVKCLSSLLSMRVLQAHMPVLKSCSRPVRSLMTCAATMSATEEIMSLSFDKAQGDVRLGCIVLLV